MHLKQQTANLNLLALNSIIEPLEFKKDMQVIPTFSLNFYSTFQNYVKCKQPTQNYLEDD